MKYNHDKRVLVSLGETSLSIVEQPKDVIQRFLYRRLARSLELSAVRSVSLVGPELLSIRVDDNEVLRLECASPADAQAWLARLRERCRFSAAASPADEDANRGGGAPLVTHDSVATEDENDDSAKSRTSSQGSLSPDDDDDDDEMVPAQLERPTTQLHRRHTDGARLRVVPPIAADGLAHTDDIRATLTTRNNNRRPASLNSCPVELGCTELTSYLLIGGRTIASDRAGLVACGVTHVLNMAAECPNFFEHEKREYGRERVDSGDGAADSSSDDGDVPNDVTSGKTCAGHHHGDSFGLVYMHCCCTDTSTDDITPHLNAITTFVNDARSRGGKVLVHCNSGISRSSAAVLACMLRYGPDGTCIHGQSLLEAYRWLKEKRPIASPHPAYMRQLCEYEVRLRGGTASLNYGTYHNNRYEAPDKLHVSIGDPRGSAHLLGDKARPQDASPVYCQQPRPFGASTRFPNDGSPGRKRHSGGGGAPQRVTFADCGKHRGFRT
ncbi:hypothetical protein CTAYLR_003574 [Chrysophaeum taylorii]|uniref:protein-tyrosine-phosphatase n=1 Tax=Chrysophaeum taylorii TaxID=2483200 RepID=A0AAD7UL13_9STRA|nr:hypothetical protein CTAYLR_003574 [Chrysophaeum taylorii]